MASRCRCVHLLKIKGLIVLKLEEFIELPKEEKEKIFGEATRKAIAETHAAGRPSCHGDDKGVYELYPDGTKKYIKLYEKG